MTTKVFYLFLFAASTLASHPGARSRGCTWLDQDGNLWLFGGGNHQSIQSYQGGHLNDLWKYDTKALEWKWIRGNNDPTFTGIYGTLGQFNDTNNPASMWHPVCYRKDNELRIVLGNGPSVPPTNGRLLDQWALSLSKNQWAWTFGNQEMESLGAYVNRGFFTPSSLPRARTAPLFWHTGEHLYVYGGSLREPTWVGDMWKFDLRLNMYAWLQGTVTINVPSSPGTRGVSGATNQPGSRYAGMNWVSNDGSLWLVGGYGADRNGNIGYLNDVWRYIPLLNEWTWIGGAAIASAGANYGQLNQPSPDNIIGSRTGSGCWYDTKQDILYIYGGYGVNDVGAWGALNDFWTYKPSTNEWTWIGGTKSVNAVASYGTLRVPSQEVWPNSLIFPFTWTADDILWLYGGDWNEYPPNVFFAALWNYNATSGLWTWVDGFQEFNLPVEYPVIPGSPLTTPSIPVANSTIPVAISTDDSWFTSWQVFSSDVNMFNRRLLFGVGIAGIVVLDSIILIIVACCGAIKIPSKE